MSPMDQLNAFLKTHGIHHFSAEELLTLGDRAGGHMVTMPPEDIWWHAVPTLQILQRVRRITGPIAITPRGGWRPEGFNEAVGGAKDSMHKYFNAFDFYPLDRSFSPIEVGDIIDEEFGEAVDELFGIGTYPGSHFNHLDTRGIILGRDGARWDG